MNNIIYELDGKEIKIPKKEIDRLVKTMDIDEEEAIEIYLEDEGILINEEQERLCKLAKDNRVTAKVHGAKEKTEARKREVVKKENPTKQMVIAEIAKILPEFATDVVIENDSKIITFKIGDNDYKIDLIEKRKKKGE